MIVPYFYPFCKLRIPLSLFLNDLPEALPTPCLALIEEEPRDPLDYHDRSPTALVVT